MEDTAKNFRTELNFLCDISTTLAEINDSQDVVNALKLILGNYFDIKNFQVYVYDENTSSLRDFIKTWIILNQTEQHKKIEKNYNLLKKNTYNGFIINEKLLKFSLKKSISDLFIAELDTKDNQLFFPVINKNKTIGLITFEFNSVSEKTRNDEFFLSLRIAMLQISSYITNKLLNDKMQENIKFQKVMKSIAKLIENQFELNYILPIIGELIDRFISEHLIYIFTKNEQNQYNLFWPLDCQDNNIFKLLKKFNDKKNMLISKDKKTGLFAIRNDEKAIGVIAASSSLDKLSKSDIDYLIQFSAQASITTQRANSYAEALKYATLDALTGLNNRRQFEVRLKQEVSNAKRNNKPLCCIMLDIDYFKKVNDTWGHSAGDCVLKSVAKIIRQELREYDIASRYGGEEFCILLPFTKIKEAVFVANRLRQAVEKAGINISNDETFGNDILKVTISIGVSEFKKEIDSPEKLYQLADIALYEAKHRGRNRVVVYDENLEG